MKNDLTCEFNCEFTITLIMSYMSFTFIIMYVIIYIYVIFLCVNRLVTTIGMVPLKNKKKERKKETLNKH